MYTKIIDIKSDGKGNEFYSVNYYNDGKYIGFDKVWTLNAAINVNLQVPAQLKRINFDREKHYITFDQNHVYLTETMSGDRETVEIIDYNWQLIYYDVYMECFVYEDGTDIEYKYIGKNVFRGHENDVIKC